MNTIERHYLSKGNTGLSQAYHRLNTGLGQARNTRGGGKGQGKDNYELGITNYEKKGEKR